MKKKKKTVLIDKKITESNEINKSRIQILKEREGGLSLIFDEAKNKLQEISHNHDKYKELIKKLLLQGLVMLKENEITVQCREEDIEIVQDSLSKAKKDYEELTGGHVNISINKQVYLPPYPECSGGVVLSAEKGKILCNNTLDARLKNGYDLAIPKIRHLLFGLDESDE